MMTNWSQLTKMNTSVRTKWETDGMGMPTGPICTNYIGPANGQDGDTTHGEREWYGLSE